MDSHHLIFKICVCVTVSTRAALRSAARGDLVVPRTRRGLGNRAFCVAGPTAWNSLPSDIRVVLLWQLWRIYTRLIYLSSHIMQHNFECPFLYGAFMDMLRRLINCCIIIIIIIIILFFRPSVLNSRGYKILKSKQVRPQRRLLGGESAVEGDRISPLKGHW